MEKMPEYCTEKMLEYLDELRESGETNMFGAGPYVAAEFNLSRTEAREVCIYWMDTFGERKAAIRTETATSKAE